VRSARGSHCAKFNRDSYALQLDPHARHASNFGVTVARPMPPGRAAMLARLTGESTGDARTDRGVRS